MATGTASTQFISVTGAGVHEVNGVYQRYSVENGSKKAMAAYVKSGFWEGKKSQFIIEADTYGLGVVCWRIKAKSSDNINLYRAPRTHLLHPPLTGWESCGVGRDPVPVINLGPEIFFPEGIAANFKKLLFSEKHADVKFVCNDNVTVLAHKIVLVASSTYFDAAFDGPWKENDTGEWKISYPSCVWKEILTLMYTGTMDTQRLEKEPLAFASAASEYQLNMLKPIVESSCIELVSDSNIKDMVKAAHMYKHKSLMSACADYVKRKPLKVLLKTEIQSLRTEFPDAWEELEKTIDEEDCESRPMKHLRQVYEAYE